MSISRSRTSHRFRHTTRGTFRIVFNDDGDVSREIPLANFWARIITEFHITDGATESIEFELEVHLKHQRYTIVVSANDFERVSWPLARIGAHAIIGSGYNVRDELREAIQLFSVNPPPRGIHVYSHTGWINLAGRHYFLHGGGIIGADLQIKDPGSGGNRDFPNSAADNDLVGATPIAPISDVQGVGVAVRLSGPLQKYCFPASPDRNQTITAIRSALDFLALGPDRITMPLLAAAFRVVVAPVNFSLFMFGPSGCFKSELTALLMAFFGPGITVDDLTGWNSTANTMAGWAHLAKDVVFPVDDFIAAGSRGDIQQKNRQADNLLRSQANKAGRGRCRGDGTPMEGKAPRGLILSTGEMLPAGESLNARFLAIEIEPGDVLDPSDSWRMAQINAAQAAARRGDYAAAMRAFIEWSAPQLDSMRAYLPEQREAFREVFREPGVHPRSVDIAADLLAGFDQFLDFARQFQAIDEAQLDDLWKRLHEALRAILESQRQAHFSENPATRFLQLLAKALHCGRAHLKSLNPDELPRDLMGDPCLWGYARRFVRDHSAPYAETAPDLAADDMTDYGPETDDALCRTIYVPRGEQVGWRQNDDLYFEPDLCLALVNRLARQLNTPEIALGRKALLKRLKERGLLMTSEKDRNTLRRKIEGARVEVLHMLSHHFVDLCLDEDEPLEDEIEERNIAFAARQAELQRIFDERRRRKDRELYKEMFKLLPGEYGMSVLSD